MSHEWNHKLLAVHINRRSSLLLLLLLIIQMKETTSLTCLTCMFTPSTTQLDNFRVSTKLRKPFCPLEPIKCDRDQDVCVTISMHVGGGDYWMGAGCDRRANFQHMSVSCQNVHTTSRNIQLGYVQERRSMQRVCVCQRDLCNSTVSTSRMIPAVLLLFLARLLV